MVPPLDVVEQFETLDGKIQPLDYAASKNNPEDFLQIVINVWMPLLFIREESSWENVSLFTGNTRKRTDGTTEEYSYENLKIGWERGKCPVTKIHEKWSRWYLLEPFRRRNY